MDDVFKRWMYILGFISVVVFLSGYFISDKTEAVELPVPLAAVKCLPAPENDKHASRNRALLDYNSYAIYSLCIPSYMMARKDELRCGYSEENPDVLECDDNAILKQSFVHAGIDDIYAATSANTRTPNPKSKVTITFSQRALPLPKPQFQYFTEETYVTQGIHTPSRLQLRSNPLCQSPLNGKPQGQSQVVRDSSSCLVSARFDILKINLDIESYANDYDKLSRSEQIDEINFWLAFVNELVVAQ